MNLEELFRQLGYTKEEYNEIRNNYSLIQLKDETLFTNVKRNYYWLMISNNNNLKQLDFLLLLYLL